MSSKVLVEPGVLAVLGLFAMSGIRGAADLTAARSAVSVEAGADGQGGTRGCDEPPMSSAERSGLRFEEDAGGGHRADFELAGYEATIERGTALVSRDGRPSLRFGLRSYGCGGAIEHQTANDAMALRETARLDSDARTPVRSWFVARKEGLEFGYDVSEGAACAGRIRLELATSAGLEARGTAEEAIFWEQTRGAFWAMRGLMAVDADGSPLPAEFTYSDGGLAIEVDARRARWPVVVDPLVVRLDWAHDHEPEGTDVPSPRSAGFAVAFSGDGSRALVGAPDSGTDVDRPGWVFAYERDAATGAWTELQRLTASDGAHGGRFGRAAAMSADGTWAIVGGAGADPSTGAPRETAYILERDSASGIWSEVQRLTSPEPTPARSFAHAVSLDREGARALISAVGTRGDGSSVSGAVYVFERDATSGAWAYDAELTATTGSADFGHSLSVSEDGDRTLIGDPGASSNQGAAYLFERDVGLGAWSEQRMFVASDGVDGAEFGHSVALSGDGNHALVGALRHGPSHDGAVYVFDRDVLSGAWSVIDQLAAPPPPDHDGTVGFGHSVALSGDGTRALVGSHRTPGFPEWEDATGKVWFYERDAVMSTWGDGVNLEASHGRRSDLPGYSLALTRDGSRALIGARRHSHEGVKDSGAAYVFEREEHSATWTSGDELVASGGAPARGWAFGSAIAMSGDGSRALVAAPGWSESRGGHYVRGQAILYERHPASDEPREVVRLSGPTGRAAVDFGKALALNDAGTLALVGAPRDSEDGMDGVGAVYVYAYDPSTEAWSAVDRLLASDAIPGANFGDALAVSGDGDRAIVGAPAQAVGGVDGAGQAYIFERDPLSGAWVEVARLDLPYREPEFGDRFGLRVAISGDGRTVLVSVGNPVEPLPSDDAAIVYERDPANGSWSAVDALMGSGFFAPALALNEDGTRALVGDTWRAAPPDSDIAMGMARVYERPSHGEEWAEGWQLRVERPGSGGAGAFVGSAVSLSDDGEVALVSTSIDWTGGVCSAFVFERDRATEEWREAVELPSEADPSESCPLGIALSGDGSWGVVGVPNLGSSRGAVRIYRLDRTNDTDTSDSGGCGCAAAGMPDRRFTSGAPLVGLALLAAAFGRRRARRRGRSARHRSAAGGGRSSRADQARVAAAGRPRRDAGHGLRKGGSAARGVDAP